MQSRLEAMRRPTEVKLLKVAEVEAEQFAHIEGAAAVAMAGASGGKAVTLAGMDATLSTRVRLRAGLYRVVVRGRAPKSENDAFYLGLTSTGERRSYIPGPEWCDADAIVLPLGDTGEQEVLIRPAEPNVVIDKVTFYTGGDALGPAVGERNYVLDGTFEETEGGKLSCWELAHAGIGLWGPDAAVRRTGRLTVRLEPRITAQSQHQEHAVQQSVGGPRLPPPGQYLFEVWARVSRDYTGAPPSAAVNHYGKATRNWHTVKMDAGAPRDEWVPLRVGVHLPEDTTGVYVQLKAYGTQGSVWFDDASLRAVLEAVPDTKGK